MNQSLRLEPNLLSLLAEILNARNRDLTTRATSTTEWSAQEIDLILAALAEELCERGLGEDDEPNERGRLVEALIDYFARASARQSRETR